MTLHRFRTPDTALARICPAYREAMADVDHAIARDDYKALIAAWRRADLAAEAFGQGAEFQKMGGGRT